MLLSKDMKGKLPVRSEYTTPVCTQAKALKQNMFTIEELPSSIIMCGNACTCAWLRIGCGWTAARESMSCVPGNTGDGCEVTMSDMARGCVGLVCVLLIPCHALFMCSLAVAGLGFRCFRITFSNKFGHPLRKPLHIAFRSI